MDDDAALDLALTHVRRWPAGIEARRVPAEGTPADAAARPGTRLPPDTARAGAET